MRNRFARSMISVAIAAVAVSAVIAIPRTSAQAPAPALKMSWGEPDLQGIWTDETDTPLQRSPRFANQEFFTEAQRAELDQQRSALLRRDKRVERGTELDVAGAYNAVFTSMKRTGARTSLIVDPPNGRLPPLTPEAQKLAAAGQHSPVVWRLAWPLGRQYPRDRRDELQSEDRSSGLAREPAPDRTLDADQPDHARIRRDH